MSTPIFRERATMAFTLMELLIAISIIVILFSLVVASFPRIRASSSNAQCVSNLRQLGFASQLYTQDHGGEIIGLGPTNQTVYMERGWRPTLAAYLGENGKSLSKAFVCPEAANDPDMVPAWEVAITQQNSYGANKNLLKRPADSVANPASKAFIVDVYRGYLSASESFFDSNVWGVSRRHPGETTNVLWLDGHVSNFGTNDLRQSKYTELDPN